jgi:hypothetical protein
VGVVAFLAVSPMAGHARVAPTKASTAWVPVRMAWGDPDIEGVYTNNDENLIPLERPSQFDGRRLEDITAAELAALRRMRDEQQIDTEISQRLELRSPRYWAEDRLPHNSRAWLIVDPPDGKVPQVTPEVLQRAAARAEATRRRGPADSWEDRGLWERCITRGLPGSMVPDVYGNAYQIIQGPGYVAIRYEMVHETRIIPLSGSPHIGQGIREYMGDPRGHWEGNMLVVETTNFTDKTDYPGPTENLRLSERFKPMSVDVIEWTVTFDDPRTWARPWTFAMNLTRKADGQHPFEYACHEGNYSLRNILSGARAEDERAAEQARTRR